MTTEAGQPAELFLTPGSWSDDKGLLDFDFDLLERALSVNDKTHNTNELEAVLGTADLNLQPFEIKNFKRLVPALSNICSCTSEK